MGDKIGGDLTFLYERSEADLDLDPGLPSGVKNSEMLVQWRRKRSGS